ncbi:myb-like DNA-binding / high mobility group box domain-containing protein [Neospora caninum Liverpool]|uniref:Myb-like DNA-binding / high mobility group box domain-containing protein n=1 Tax=Neospora caninum (strain Liverpool) TaxID=572307 RepID=F0VF32_NEOCL|nr:myb-like DNA-binding / high mobility group box domain-containing protein [Neospora caninum Liverpool]CBZ52326.1 myb-like DNA-binding / high mobility group box domain-containing protein [Neospora caninum Liverpool]|eukprot:XP_003882358.1 myb-like DNA-binding / high mobility group box domain-containing protein [Neospora caninum Liverpool]
MPPGVSPQRPAVLDDMESSRPTSLSSRTDPSSESFSFRYPSPSALFDPGKGGEASYAPCSSLFSFSSNARCLVKTRDTIDFDSLSHPSHLSSFTIPSSSLSRSYSLDSTQRKADQDSPTHAPHSLLHTDIFSPLASLFSRRSGCTPHVCADGRDRRSSVPPRGSGPGTEATESAPSLASGAATLRPKDGSPGGRLPERGTAAQNAVSREPARPSASCRSPSSDLSLLFAERELPQRSANGENSGEIVTPFGEGPARLSPSLSGLPTALTLGACTLTQGGSTWDCRPSGEDFPLRFVPLLHAEPVRGGVEQAVPLDPGPLAWSACPFTVDPLAFSLSSTLGEGFCSPSVADPSLSLHVSVAALAVALKFASAMPPPSTERGSGGVAPKGSSSPLRPEKEAESEREKEQALVRAYLQETQRRRKAQLESEEEANALMPLGAVTAASKKQHDELFQAFHVAHRVADSWVERLASGQDWGKSIPRQPAGREPETQTNPGCSADVTEKRGEASGLASCLGGTPDCGQTDSDGLQEPLETRATDSEGRNQDKGEAESQGDAPEKPRLAWEAAHPFLSMKLSCRPSSAARSVLYKALRGVANDLAKTEQIARHLREKTEPSAALAPSPSVPSPGAVSGEPDALLESSGSGATSSASADSLLGQSSLRTASSPGGEESKESTGESWASGVGGDGASSLSFLEEEEEAEEAEVQQLVRRTMLLRCLRDLLGEHRSLSLQASAALGVSPASKSESPSTSSSSTAGSPSSASSVFDEEKLRQERILSLLLRQVERHEDRQVPALLLSAATPKPVKQHLVQVLLAEVLAEISVTYHQERLHFLHRPLSKPIKGLPSGEKTPASLAFASASASLGKGGTQPGLLGNPLTPSHPPADGCASLPVDLAGPSPLSILQCLVRAQRAEAATAEVQADVVAAGRAALLRLAQLAPRLTACVPLLLPYLPHLPRLLHVQIQLLAQQAQRGDLTAKAVEEKLLKHFKDQEAFACTPFLSTLSQQLTECLSASRPTLPAPGVAALSGLAPGAGVPQAVASGLLAPGAAPFLLAQGAGGERGLGAVGSLAPGLAGVNAARDDGRAASAQGGPGGKPAASAAKKPSRKGMGMSGWALFAKEKRAELQQEGRLEGETLPEQTSFVARFWHQLSKEKKAEWGRRAEELNRQAGLRMKKEEEIRKMKEAEAEKKRAAEAAATALPGPGLATPLREHALNLTFNQVLGGGLHHPSLAAFSAPKSALPGGVYAQAGADDRAQPAPLSAGKGTAGPATRVHADGPVSFGGRAPPNPSTGGGLPGDGVSQAAAQAGEAAAQVSAGFARIPQPQGHPSPFSASVPVPGATAGVARAPQRPLEGQGGAPGAEFPAAAKKKSRSGGGGKKGEGGQAKGGRGYTAFTFFAKEMRQKCKEEGIECGTSLSEQNTFIGDKWRQVSPEEKKIFQQRAKEANEAWRREHEEKLQAQQKEEHARRQEASADPALAFSAPHAGPNPSTGPPQAPGAAPSPSIPASAAYSSFPAYSSPGQAGAYQPAAGPGHQPPAQGYQGAYPSSASSLQERRGDRESLDAFGHTASHLTLSHTASGPGSSGPARLPPEQARGDSGAPSQPSPYPAESRALFSASPSSFSAAAAAPGEEEGARGRASSLDSASPPLKKRRGDGSDEQPVSGPFVSSVARAGVADPKSGAGGGVGTPERGEMRAGERDRALSVEKPGVDGRERQAVYPASPLPSSANVGQTTYSMGSRVGPQRVEVRGVASAMMTPEAQWRREDEAFSHNQVPSVPFTPPPSSMPSFSPKAPPSPFASEPTFGPRKQGLPVAHPALASLAYPPEEVMYQLKFDSPFDGEEGRRDEDREEERGRSAYAAGDRAMQDRVDYFVSEQVHSAPLPSRRSARAASRGALERRSPSERAEETARRTSEDAASDGDSDAESAEEREGESSGEGAEPRKGPRSVAGRGKRREHPRTRTRARDREGQDEASETPQLVTRCRLGASGRNARQSDEAAPDEGDVDEGEAEEQDEEWEESGDYTSDEEFVPASRSHSTSARKGLTRKASLSSSFQRRGEDRAAQGAPGRGQRRPGAVTGTAGEPKGSGDEETGEVGRARNTHANRKKRDCPTQSSRARARRRREDGKELLQLSLPASIVEKEGPLTLWDLIQRNKRRPPSSARGGQDAGAKAKAGASGKHGGREEQKEEADESFDSVLGSLFSAPPAFGPASLNSGADQALQPLLAPASPAGDRKGREEDEGTAEKDLSALFDTPGQGSAPALRLDADGQLVMAEGGEELEPPVCTCGASLGLFDGLGQAAPCVCLFNGRRRLVEEGGPGGVNGLSLQPYAGAYKSTKGKRWTPEETQRFYAALEQYGTDLLLVGTLLPHVTDKQLKLKLKIEERRCPEKMHGKINTALHYRRALGSSSSDDSDGESESPRNQIVDSPAFPQPALPSAPAQGSSFPALLSILAGASVDAPAPAENADVDPSLFALPLDGGTTGDDLLALFG